jgi:hypothetical protein
VNFYREAAIALRQNGRSVLYYIAAGMLIAALDAMLDLFVLAPASGEAPDTALNLALIVSSILMVALGALASTIFFARVGREMDKPMWRVADDRDALRLFYRMWLLLGLLTLAYARVMEQFLSSADSTGLIVFLCTFFIWATLLNVFGAFVMFYGRTGRDELNAAFGTFAHHLGPIIAVSLVGLLAGLMLVDAQQRILQIGTAADATPMHLALRVLLTTLLGGADSLVSIFIFAYAWLVCIFHRDHFEEPGDDFDF